MKDDVCAPNKTYNNGSCFTLENLQFIAEKFTSDISKRILSYIKPYLIVKALSCQKAIRSQGRELRSKYRETFEDSVYIKLSSLIGRSLPTVPLIAHRALYGIMVTSLVSTDA